MRRLFFILLALLSIAVYAQQQNESDVNWKKPFSVTFDFTDPLSLNPSVTPANEGGLNVDVSNIDFKVDSLALRFNRIGRYADASIFTFYSYLYEEFRYWLQLSSGTQMELCCNNGIIKSIDFLGAYQSDSDLSGLALDQGQSGEVNYYDKKWQSDPSILTSKLLMTQNSSRFATLYKMRVNYYLNRALYNPDVNLDPKVELNSFSSIQLTFPVNVSFKDSNDFKITYRENELGRNVTINGNNAIISLGETVYNDGEVKIHIPAGCFIDADNYCNKELDYTFNIVKKRDTFVPVAFSPANNSHVVSLVSGDLFVIFDGSISDFDSNIHFRLFKEGNSEPVCLLKPVRGENSNVIKLEFVENVSDVIMENGTYNITIPAKTFYHFKGDADYESWNPEFVLTYDLGYKETLVPAVTPAHTSLLEEISNIVLTFQKDITYNENGSIEVLFNGEAVDYTLTVEGTVVTIALTEAITADGEVTVHFPASCFITEDYLGNRELDYRFYVKNPVTRKKDDAREVLKHTGIGYPKVTSASYIALQALLDNADATVEDIDAAVDALYKETDIQLPENDKFYEIAFVNDEGKTLFVSHADDNNLSVTENAANATVFETTVEDEKVVFKTMDNKYLRVLAANDCLTDEKTSDNLLDITRLIVEGKEKETFGLMSMYGLFSKSSFSEGRYSYAVVDFDEETIVKEEASSLFYGKRFSSALRLVSTEKPDVYVKLTAPTVSCTQTNGSYILTLAFDKAENVAINVNPAKVAVKLDGAAKADSLELVATGEVGVFTVALGSKGAGNYTVTIPEKTLISTVAGEVRFSKELSATFRIKDILEANFTTSDSFCRPLRTYLLNTYYNCEDLNDFGYYVEVDEKFNGSKFAVVFNDTTMTFIMKDTYMKDEDKIRYMAITDSLLTVMQSGGYPQKIDSILVDGSLYRVESYYSPRDIVPSAGYHIQLKSKYTYQYRKARFVTYDTGKNDIRAIKIEFEDGPIKPNELPDDDYEFYVDKAAFGDANFYKYLLNQNCIAPERCVVNPSFYIPVSVDQSLAGIKDVVSDKRGNSAIYDITGRKVQDMSHPGVYIVNGRKVLVK